MPSENTTTCHGASRITLRVDIRCPRAATPSSTSAPAPATALIGTPIRPSPKNPASRSEEHTSELQSLMRISYAVFCLKNKTTTTSQTVQKQQKLQTQRT